MPDLQVSFPKPCGEEWETMTPSGCNRICSKCDTVIHDLSQYEASQIKELLSSEPDCCVRAFVNASGVVATKPSRQKKVRRIIASIGASTSLLISQPSTANEKNPNSAILGQIFSFGFKTTVIARDNKGNTFRSKVRSDGHYKIKNVPAGIYALEFIPDCGESWTVENIIVADGNTVVPVKPNEGGCIVVGRLELRDYKA